MRNKIYLELNDDSFIEKIREEIGKSINAVAIFETKEELIGMLQEEDEQ